MGSCVAKNRDSDSESEKTRLKQSPKAKHNKEQQSHHRSKDKYESGRDMSSNQYRAMERDHHGGAKNKGRPQGRNTAPGRAVNVNQEHPTPEYPKGEGGAARGTHVTNVVLHNSNDSNRDMKEQLDRQAVELRELREKYKKLDKRNEHLERKNNQLENQNTEFNNQIQPLKRRLENQDATISSLMGEKQVREQEIADLKAQNEALNAKPDKKKKKKEDETQFQELQLYWKQIAAERDEHIKNLEGQVRELGAKNESLLKNMSSLMNQTMARDESDLENINVKNRPMNVMDDFTTFCSQQWLDAKTVIDDWAEEQHREVDDEVAFNLLLDGIHRCYSMAEDLLTATTKHFESVIENPLQRAVVGDAQKVLTATELKPEKKPKRRQRRMRELDVDFRVSIAKALKLASDNVDFTQCAKNLSRQFLQERSGSTGFDPKLAEHEDVLDFFTRCIEISWNMLIQQPPMKFQCLPEPGSKYQDVKHELHFNSADPKQPGAVIHYYVHPAVCHGEKQMKKARVVLHIPEAWSEHSRLSSSASTPMDTTQAPSGGGKPKKRSSREGGKGEEPDPKASKSEAAARNKGTPKDERKKQRNSAHGDQGGALQTGPGQDTKF